MSTTKFHRDCVQAAAYLREFVMGAEQGAHIQPAGEIAARLGVSRAAVAHEIDVLLCSGVLKHLAGCGEFVKQPRTSKSSAEKRTAMLYTYGADGRPALAVGPFEDRWAANDWAVGAYGEVGNEVDESPTGRSCAGTSSR